MSNAFATFALVLYQSETSIFALGKRPMTELRVPNGDEKADRRSTDEFGSYRPLVSLIVYREVLR